MLSTLVSPSRRPAAPARPGDARARFDALDRERVKAGLAIERVAAAAGLTARYYLRLRAGERAASDRALQRIKTAITRCRRGDVRARDAERELITATYGGFLATICALTGLDVERVRAADPKRGSSIGRNGEGLQIARARMLAIYLTHTAVAVPQRRLAELIGVSPAAICLAIQSIEDLRDDDRDFTRLIEEVQRRNLGSVA